MIPKIIHFVWLGGKEIPNNLKAYIVSWHRWMPESHSVNERRWIYMEWNERTLAEILGEDWLQQMPLYVQQAYAAKKFAFVSDYIRLWVLERYGGVYFDTDVEVIRSFDELQEFTMHNAQCTSFIGFEESRAKTLGTNVIGTEPHSQWVQEMLEYYERASFIKGERLKDGAECLQVRSEGYDMTPNSELIARLLTKYGLVRNGKEQYVEINGERLMDAAEKLQVKGVVIHVYDYHHFSPITSTRVMRKTKDTFSIHHCYGSWTEGSKGNRIRNSVIVREIVNTLIQMKRFISKH